MSSSSTKLRLKKIVNYNHLSHTNTEHQNIIQRPRQVCQYLSILNISNNTKQKQLALYELISICYSNKINQFYLCNNIKIPFQDGPITLTKIPKHFRDKLHQVIRLFDYLKKIKESYICWLIFVDHDLGILNLKLVTQYELKDVILEYGLEQVLYGIFIGKKYNQKSRAKSTKCSDDFSLKQNLSTKTTKESFMVRESKSKQSKSKSKYSKILKSLSMKEKLNKTEGQGKSKLRSKAEVIKGKNFKLV